MSSSIAGIGERWLVVLHHSGSRFDHNGFPRALRCHTMNDEQENHEIERKYLVLRVRGRRVQ